MSIESDIFGIRLAVSTMEEKVSLATFDPTLGFRDDSTSPPTAGRAFTHCRQPEL